MDWVRVNQVSHKMTVHLIQQSNNNNNTRNNKIIIDTMLQLRVVVKLLLQHFHLVIIHLSQLS